MTSTNACTSAEEANSMQKLENRDTIPTTLPMEDLIGFFESEINDMIDYDSFEYENAKNTIHIFHGTPKLHKCNYKINTARLELGQITFTRSTPFDEAEINLIEGALGALVIHLNNALDYQSGPGADELNSLRTDTEYSSLS
jgi:hypothetical protein